MTGSISLRSFGKVLLGMILATVCFAHAVLGQSGTSTVRGRVVDAQGKAVVGATITLTSQELSFTRTQTTNQEGAFAFPSLTPGTYKLAAESKGFKKADVNEVRALVDSPTDVNVQLEVGNINETVEITSTGVDALINTTDATIGNNFVAQQISQLPLNNRNVINLLTLQPGVTQDGYVAGARSDQTNITLDGADVNEQQTGAALSPVLRVTPDSVEEFRITTTNPNANQGRSAGAQASLVTKSGSNTFHETLYEYHRDNSTEANDFFNNSAGIGRGGLVRNLPGGSIGGPIIKDRLFFFYNFEAFRESTSASVVRTVPLASLGAGNIVFPDGKGGVTTLTPAMFNSLFPAAGENAAALSLLADAAKRYPANDTTVGDGFNTGGFRFNAPIKSSENTNIARLDYNLTRDGKQVIFFRGNLQYDLIGNVSQFPDTPTTDTWFHPFGFVVGHTWSINSRDVNNFRYGYTRQAFSSQGDSGQNSITFRGVFTPFSYSRTFDRVTPVKNITDDFSMLRGNHTLEYGTNIRIIRNERTNFASSFDAASTNQFFYASSGAVLKSPITNAGFTIKNGFASPVESAVAAVIGRLVDYTENFNFDLKGNPLPAGSGVKRNFATEQYDFYAQDSWKIKSNLTITYGLRYGVSRPVYETQGFQAKPNVDLGAYFQSRINGADNGTPFNDPISVVLAGPVNNAPGFYKTDWKNFQPRLAVAWSPNFRDGFLHKIFGNAGDSVVRSGFAVLSDNFGEALAVNFDGNNKLGFASSTSISANTFNATTRLGPLFTGLGMAVRGLPGIAAPGNLSFPQIQPSDGQRRIEGSLDSTLQTPKNYSFDLSFGRKLPANMYLEVAYIGRLGRHLLATRDIMQPNDLVDPKTGVDWYTAAGQLEKLRAAGASLSSIPNIPYFTNIFGTGLASQLANFYGDSSFNGLTPAQAVYNIGFSGNEFGNDWTSYQTDLDNATGKSFFFQPQYGALSVFSTIARSDYHAMTVSLRQRFHKSVTLDFNYTLSHSIDTASGLQTSGVYGSAFILNALRPNDNRADSDFDSRHIVNANALIELPFGKGKMFLGDTNRVVDTIIGGWQLTGIFRYNSGVPAVAPFDSGRWATNWNVESDSVPIMSVSADPNRGGNNQSPNLFGNQAQVDAAYRSFRSAMPGETGARNILRYPGFIGLDMGLAKSFKMPYKEGHSLQLRVDTFNVTNTQHFTGISDFSTGLDPQTLDANGQPQNPGPKFGTFTAIQGIPRVMQFAIRYSF